MRQRTKCEEWKVLEDFYKHPSSVGGRDTKCKECVKGAAKKNFHKKIIEDPDFRESERTRGREKYRRLEYAEKYRGTSDPKRNGYYVNKYPEKYAAAIAAQRIPNTKGNNHHWSYCTEHHKDVIDMDPKEHAKAHRFIVYDQERMMYRRFDTSELLNTKEKHVSWIEHCLSTFGD